MALMPKPRATDELIIRPISDDAEYAEAHTKLDALRSELAATERRIQISDLEAAMPSASPSNQAWMRQRLKILRASASHSAGSTSAATPSAIEKGIGLILGKRLPTPEPVEQIAQARQDLLTLDAAVRDQTAIVSEIRERKTYEASLKLVDLHRARILATFRAAQTLAAAHEAEKEIHRLMTAAGYGNRYDVLPTVNVGAIAALGVETDPNSHITAFRRALEERKIL